MGKKVLLIVLFLFLVPCVYSLDLNISQFSSFAPIYVNSDGNGDRVFEPMLIDLNITCFYDNKSDLRIIYNNDTLVNFRRTDNNTRAIIEINSSNIESNDYWIYCYDQTATDLNNESFFRVYDDFEKDFDTSNWYIMYNGSDIKWNSPGRLELKSEGLVSSTSVIYNKSGGYYNFTEPNLYYKTIIKVIPDEVHYDPDVPFKYIGFAETNLVTPSDVSGSDSYEFAYGSVSILQRDRTPMDGGSQCFLNINATSEYSCDTKDLFSTPTITFIKNSTNHVEYIHNTTSILNTTQVINNTNATPFFRIERSFTSTQIYVYKVAMNTNLFNIYEPESIVYIGSEEYAPFNINTPVIEQKQYYENDSLIAYEKVNPPSNSFQAKITWNSTRGINYTQYISSISSFENGYADTWTGANIINTWATEGNKSITGDTIERQFNLSMYDFMIVDFDLSTINDDNFIIYVNTTSNRLHRASTDGTKGNIQTNYYINLSDYNGVSTIGFKRDKCFSCTSGNFKIDNIRFGGLDNISEYNISSNTNITTILPINLNVFNVNDNITAVFEITDNYTTSINISNLVNISNRLGIVGNITVSPLPILETNDASISSFNYTDPDDTHTNVTHKCLWFVNGVNVSTECILNNTNITIGDSLVASLSVSDGYNYSGWYNSSEIIVGDLIAPTLENISVPTTGVIQTQLTITLDCIDDVSNVSVKMNVTDPDLIVTPLTASFLSGNIYIILYTPSKIGLHTFGKTICSDTSSNQDVSNTLFVTSIESESIGGNVGGGGGGSSTPVAEQCLFDYDDVVFGPTEYLKSFLITNNNPQTKILSVEIVSSEFGQESDTASQSILIRNFPSNLLPSEQGEVILSLKPDINITTKQEATINIGATDCSAVSRKIIIEPRSNETSEDLFTAIINLLFKDKVFGISNWMITSFILFFTFLFTKSDNKKIFTRLIQTGVLGILLSMFIIGILSIFGV